MKLQPLADRIVIKKIEAEAKSASGILLPDSAKDKSQTGQVLAVGKEVTEVKVGDQVIYPMYGSAEVKVDGDELLIAKEEDILAVVKGGK